MSLIDKTYFVKDINIPDSAYNDLDAYIERYEKEILIQLLGYELWKLVDSNNGQQPVASLINGKEYQVNGITVKWGGLVNKEKISLIAYYVFYQWARNNATFTAMTGERQSNDENAQSASLAQRLSHAWMKLEEMAQSTDYPYNSLYMFLSQNQSDYPTWIFTPIGNVNAFDL